MSLTEARACWEKAVQELARNRPAQAHPWIARALELDEDALPEYVRRYPNLNGSLLRARAWAHSGYTQKARYCFEQALEAEPDNEHIALEFACTLCRWNRPDEAVRLLESWFGRRAASPLGLTYLGEALVQCGRQQEGHARFDEALQLGASAAIWGAKGKALYHEEARLEEALVCFEAGLRLEPDQPLLLQWAVRVLRQLLLREVDQLVAPNPTWLQRLRELAPDDPVILLAEALGCAQLDMALASIERFFHGYQSDSALRQRARLIRAERLRLAGRLFEAAQTLRERPAARPSREVEQVRQKAGKGALLVPAGFSPVALGRALERGTLQPLDDEFHYEAPWDQGQAISGEICWRNQQLVVTSATRSIPLPGLDSELQAGALSGNGRLLATVSQENTVELWDLTTGARCWRRTLTSPLDDTDEGPYGRFSTFVERVALDLTGRSVLLALNDGTCHLLSGASGQTRALFRASGSSSEQWQTVRAVTFSTDGRLLAAGFPSGREVRVWETESGALRYTLRIAAEPAPERRRMVTRPLPCSLAFSEDNAFLLALCEDEVGCLWDLACGQPLLESADVRGVSARRVLGDSEAALWYAPGGPYPETLDARRHYGFRPVLSRDGSLYLTADSLWSVQSGERLTRLPLRREEWVVAGCLSAQRVVIATCKGRVLWWPRPAV